MPGATTNAGGIEAADRQIELPALPFYGLIKILSEDFTVQERRNGFAVVRELWFRRLCRPTETDCDHCEVARFQTRAEADAALALITGQSIREAA